MNLPGPGQAWSFGRTYGVIAGVDGQYSEGNRWLNNPNDIYIYQVGSDIRLLAPGGVSRTFIANMSGGFDAPADCYLVLTYDATNNQYVVTDKAQNIRWTFNDFVTAPYGFLKELTTQQLTSQGKSGYSLSYDSQQRLTQVTGPTGQDYNIVYTWSGNRITKVQTKDASSNLLAQVDYKYYQDVVGASSDLGGTTDDLVQVKVSKKATNDTGSTLSIVRYIQYRYVDDVGSPYTLTSLKAVYEHDAIQRAMAANSLSTPEDLLTKADTYGSPQLKNFASRSFVYYTTDQSTSSINTPFQASENLESTYGATNVNETYPPYPRGMVKSETIGGCGSCGTSGSITKTYFYMNLPGDSSDQNQTTRLVVEDTQDSAGNAVYRTLYAFDGYVGDTHSGGRMLRRAFIQDPVGSPKYWCESWTFATSTGSSNLPYRLAEHRYPSAHTCVTSASNVRDFLNPYNGINWNNDTNTLNSSAGLIEVHSYNTAGLRTDSWIKNGSGGTAYYVSARDYGDGTNDTVLTAEYDYPTQTTTRANGIATSYSYTWYDSGSHLQMKTKTTTLPTISSGQNGSGVATTTSEYYDNLGRLRWTQDGEGYINYYAYHPSMGKLAYKAVDIDSGSVSSEISSGSSGNWEDWTAAGANSNKPTRSGSLPSVLNLTMKTYYDKLGRMTRRTDYAGANHYTTYENLRTISYPYWDSTNSKTLLPVRVQKLNSATQLSEQIAVKASYTAFTTSSSVPTGFSTEPTQSDYVEWTRYSYDVLTGRLFTTDRYANIPSSGTGTLGTDFHRSVVQYDLMNRKEYEIQVLSGSSTTDRKEQVTQRAYDILNRIIEVKSGVSGDNSANSHNMTDNYNSYPTMATISKLEYDGAGVGDGHVTKVKKYFGSGSNDYTGSNFKRTYRGVARGVEPFYMASSTETSISPYTVNDVDWKGRATSTALYDTVPTWSTVLTGDGYSAYSTSTATNRRAREDLFYDDAGRAYQIRKYEITASSGTGSNYLLTDLFYDRNDRQVGIQPANAAAMEFAFDGAGRQYQSRNVIALASTKYSSGQYQYRSPAPNPTLGSMSGGDDGIIQLEHIIFNGTRNVMDLHSFEATHDDLAGMSPGIDLSNNDDYVRQTAYRWYDAADRLTTSAEYGSGDPASGGGTWKYSSLPSRPGSIPSVSSNTSLVMLRSYNAESGLPEITTDFTGNHTKRFYDRLGRITYSSDNWDDFAGAAETGTGDSSDKSKDRVTKKIYDGAGNIKQLIAMDQNGDGTLTDNQVTTYLFEDAINGSRVTNEIYPDSSDTTSSGTDQIKKTFNVDGSLASETDQRGRVFDYTYTNNRLLSDQSVTTLGSGVDGAVRSIKRNYDSLNRLQNVTSYASTGGTGSVVNDVQTAYNDFGQEAINYQSHSGAANTMSSPSVQYGYDTTVSSNVFTGQHRLQSVTYPNGRVFFFDYDASNTSSPYHRFSWIRKIRETNSSGTELAIYDNTGSGKTAISDLPEPDVRLDYYQGTSGTYAGWDRFGRIKDQYWKGYGSTADVDRFHYGYDYAGSRIYRDIDSSIYSNDDRDQAYLYDGLHRLKDSQQGTLSGTTISGTPGKQETWTLDVLGNWAGYVTKALGTTDLNQGRTTNAVNEITNVTASVGSTWATPAYDAAGNMTTIPKPSSLTATFTGTYDAWNRLVKIADGAATVAEYAYDGLNRQILKAVYSTGMLDYTEHTYFNNQWQALEIRKEISGTEDPDPLEQYLWHPAFIDAPVFRDYDASTSGSQTRYYYTFDANFNITGILSQNGSAVERYHYSPYGDQTVLDANFALDSDNKSDISNGITYTGRLFEQSTGLFNYRHRYFSVQLGGFLSQDPIGYSYEQWNLYQYVLSSPTLMTDPFGLGPCGLPDNVNPNSEDDLIAFIKTLSRMQLQQMRDCIKKQYPNLWKRWIKAEKYARVRNIKKRGGSAKVSLIAGIFTCECIAAAAYTLNGCLDSAVTRAENCYNLAMSRPPDMVEDEWARCDYIFALDMAECSIIYTAESLGCMLPLSLGGD